MSRRSIRTALFCGGRGAGSIAAALAAHPQVELTLLINTYDDGLSTGRLRRFVPGMLGPSDVRKNCVALMPSEQRCLRGLQRLLEERLPPGTARPQALAVLEAIAGGRAPDGRLGEAYRDVSVRKAEALAGLARAFLEHEARRAEEGVTLDFGDCALANLLFAGGYLLAGGDFNRAVADWAALCETRAEVLNITDGEGLVLVALDAAGDLLPDEATIVAPGRGAPIEELFLLRDYLTPDEELELRRLPRAERFGWLRAREAVARPNPAALRALREADLIVYGPGTQHSSLLPSYLTVGVGEAIAANTEAAKVFVANIVHDHDIAGRTVPDLLGGLLAAMSRKGALQLPLERLVTRSFAQVPDRGDIARASGGSYVPLGADGLHAGPVVAADWEQGAGRHAGGQIADALLRIVRIIGDRVLPFRHTVSVIVPALDEARTVVAVLRQLVELDFSALGVASEVIVVDGGSTDGTLELALAQPGVRVYRLPRGSGRGAALRLGAARARGNVLAFFPADGEYSPADLLKVTRPILTEEYGAVFGSRAVKCVDLSARARQVYGDDHVGYLLGKYGGMTLSALSLLLYNRFVTDPLTSLKAFDRSLFESLDLSCEGIDLDAELIAELCARHAPILEVPVQFSPRGALQGKKTSVLGGLRAVTTLVGHRVRFELTRRGARAPRGPAPPSTAPGRGPSPSSSRTAGGRSSAPDARPAPDASAP